MYISMMFVDVDGMLPLPLLGVGLNLVCID